MSEIEREAFEGWKRGPGASLSESQQDFARRMFNFGVEQARAQSDGEEVEPVAYQFGENLKYIANHWPPENPGDITVRPLYLHPANPDGSDAVRVPDEHGKNRYGLDMAYFRNLFNRELNRPLVDFRPDELARVLARAARTADATVLREPEFHPAQGRDDWRPVSTLYPGDGDELGNVWGLDEPGNVTLEKAQSIYDGWHGHIVKWMPTGLKRPTPPTDAD